MVFTAPFLRWLPFFCFVGTGTDAPALQSRCRFQAGALAKQITLAMRRIEGVVLLILIARKVPRAMAGGNYYNRTS